MSLVPAFFLLLSYADTSASTARTAIYFEPNQGQFAPQVRFLARGAKYRAWITDNELVLETPKQAPMRLKFGPRQPLPLRAEGVDKQQGISNYFIGNNPAKWTMSVPAYSRALLHDVYPGIDVMFYAHPVTREIEYDLVVKPGADPSQISIDFDPKLRPRLEGGGTIELVTDNRTVIRHVVPLVHQGGKPVHYQLRLEGSTLRFDVPGYDREQALLIDPVITYSTYLGGTGDDQIRNIAVDSNGAMYVTGDTLSANFPVLNFTPASGNSGLTDGFVTKIGPSPVGGVHPRIYSAYFGGSQDDISFSIAVDSTGSALIGGRTASSNLPNLRAFQTIYGGGDSDGFAAKIAAAAPYGLTFATYVGGTGADSVQSVAADTNGASYLAGNTSATLTVRNAYQANPGGGGDAFIWKLAATPSGGGAGIYDLVYGTYLGAIGNELLGGIAVDSTGAAYVAGVTTSPNFPTKLAAQTTYKAGNDGFVAKFAAQPLGNGIYDLVYSTYLTGSNNEVVNDIAVDGLGNAYITGATLSTDYPVVSGTPLTTTAGFATKIAAQPSGSPAAHQIVYSTFLPTHYGSAIAVDGSGAAYVTGLQGQDVIDQIPPSADVYGTSFLMKVRPNPTAGAAWPVIFNTRLGPLDGRAFGLALDSNGAAYVAGWSTSGSPDPVVGDPAPANSAFNGFIVKVSPSASPSSVSITSASPLTAVAFTTSGIGCTPGNYTTPRTFDWALGTLCTITFPATVAGGTGSEYRFSRWLEDNSTNTTRTVQAANGNTLITASYDAYHRVKTQVTPFAGGTVTPLMDDFVKNGTSLTLIASPNPGYGFRRFETTAFGNSSELTTTYVITAPVTATAVFEQPVLSNAALQFVPVTPCRVLDTRIPPESAAIGMVTKTASIAGKCGIPVDAIAASVNVTVVPLNTLGYLTIWPAGQPQTLNSLLNALDGRVKANAAIVPLGTAGAINMFATNTTEVIIDVNGYFVTPQANTLAFYPLTPCRIIDTRLANGPLGGPFMAPLVPRTIPVTASACNVPATAKAYSLNATVVPPGLLGYLTLWPTGVTRPVVSTLNDLPGTVVANAAIVPAGTGGSIDAFVTERTELILDINGYFAPPGQPGALNFYVMTPCRVLDTRNPNGPLGGPILQAGAEREFNLPAGSCGIPAAAKGYSLNATIVPPGLFGYLSVWPAGSPIPLVSSLNAVDGAIASNAIIVPSGTGGALRVFALSQGHLIFDVNGYFLQ
jgi:hypothetical protein